MAVLAHDDADTGTAPRTACGTSDGRCNGHCHQGRWCPARRPAEACTELGADARDFDDLGPARGVIVALGISAGLTFFGVLLGHFAPEVLAQLAAWMRG